MRLASVSILALLFVGLACTPPGGGSDGDADVDGDSDADGPVSCSPGNVTCEGGVARTCNDQGDGYSETRTCEGATPRCAPGYGCVACMPSERYCEGQDVMQCDATGMSPALVETCDPARPCTGGMCRNPCEEAEASNSYEGCEYFAATLMNSQVAPEFTPAIVVSNRNTSAVQVTVTRGGATIATATVDPSSTRAIDLPWVLDLKQQLDPTGESVEQSVNVPDGAYHVTTTLPVTIYQFNPLQYRVPTDCASEEDLPDGQCFSYSNDASLLLPVHVLTEHYLVMSRPNLGIYNRAVGPFGGATEVYSFSPSTMAVINPQAEPVNVSVTFSAPTQAGPGLAAYEAGQSADFVVQPGGVLQIAARIPESCTPDWTEPESVPCGGGLYTCTYGYCAMTAFDLTGTEISASAPVAVFGGHNCDFVPYNRWACDHLEEQLFPYETWGKHFVVSQAHRENGEPDVFRVLSGADGNTVRFTPASVHEPVTLGRGAVVEFEAHGAFEVQADQPIMVGQFIVGQSYNSSTSTDLPPGDPSFAVAVPVEQYRAAYNFLAPDSFDRSYVNITTTTAATSGITLDGTDLSGAPWEAIEGSGYSVLRHELPAGSHSITSSSGTTFGIVVYGFGQYTSYMYPGGLNLEEIAVW